MLPDGDGVSLALEFRKSRPQMQLILMTGMELSDDEAALCERYDIPVLRKPFLGEDAVNLLRARLVHAPAAKTSNP
jgi:DNA-binding response OmpR family regulator